MDRAEWMLFTLFTGIGSTLGTGIYIVTGQVARETAGPAVILSFLIAGVASAFAGLFVFSTGCMF